MADRSRARHLLVALAILHMGASPLAAQTIEGRLLDADSGRPIDLGILILLTEEGDTVRMAASTADGRFSVTAPEPGSFLVRASAFGYAEREEGVFELGEGGRLDVEFRIAPRPMELDGILVSTDRPAPSHPLVRNGFVERYRRGIGHFITPRDLERTVYLDTESLFHFIPGVRIVTRSRSTVNGRTVLGPTTERVLMRNSWGSCAPTVYVDGIRTQLAYGTGERLSHLVRIGWIEAVEIYTRPAQVPAEYGGPTGNDCGLIVFWTER